MHGQHVAGVLLGLPLSTGIRFVPIAAPRSSSGRHLNRVQQKKLAGVLEGLSNEFGAKAEPDPAAARDPESLWRLFVFGNNQEIAMGIWGSQQIVYAAIFFAFENFLKDVIEVTKTDVPFDPRNFGIVKKDFEGIFGPALKEKLIEGDEFEAIRHARHCLAHRGGRESEELKDTKHKISVHEGSLEVMAADSRDAMRKLEGRALVLVKEALNLSAFR